ncbi:MAG: amino acid adenylation domain-containing protein [Arenicellales bacterium]
MSAPLHENIEDAYPLSPLQQGMLFHTISSPESGVYLEQLSVNVNQQGFSPETFKKCWDLLIQRHSAFRTAFIWKDLREPLQVVRKSVSLEWVEHDWEGEDPTSQDSKLEQLKQSDRKAEFLLNKAPLMRMTLVRTGKGSYTWIWTRHHLIADGWSTNHVIKELKRLYAGLIKGESIVFKPAPPYRNYIAWLKQQNRETQQVFWKQYLQGVNHRTTLSIERVREASHRLGDYEEASRLVPAKTFDALEALCKPLRVTINTALQAAWSVLLSRYSGSDDVVWGVTVSGRPASLKGIEESVGLFINTIPLRSHINWDQPAADYLQATQSNQLTVMEHENTALTDIMHWSECPAGQSLLGSVVVYENYPSDSIDNGEPDSEGSLALSEIEYKEQSDLPLALIALPENDLRLILIYDRGVFTAQQIARMLDQLRFFLISLSLDANVALKKLAFLPVEESDTLLYKWNTTEAELNADRFIDQLILDQARSHPDATALVCGEERLSYGELDRLSHIKMTYLLSRNIMPGSVVGICLPRSNECLVWMLAVLRSGATYLMLDPQYPSSRLQEMLTHSGASVVVTNRDTSARVQAKGCAALVIDELCGIEAGPNLAPAPNRLTSDNAYILFTSGSTGVPKGVMISHRNLVHSTLAREQFYNSSPSSFLLLSSLSFDSSVAGIFWTLINGGKLVISLPRQEQDIESLLHTISTEQISHTLCLPSLYQSVLDHASSSEQKSALRSIQVVINAGEAMPSGEHLKQHRSLLPNAQIFNEYGPTEATVWCAAYDATHHDSSVPVPIGRPIANTRLFVMNPNEQLAPLGASGELVIAGDGVSAGYWQESEATQNAFRRHLCIDQGNTTVYHTGDLVRYLEDGNLIYLGRIDQQIKIRGHRIDPGEIEARILSLPDVRAVSIVSVYSRAGAPTLTAFVVMESDEGTIDTLRDTLATQLPSHMVPAQIIELPELPTLSNEKLDRQALAKIAEQHDGNSSPRNGVRQPSSEVQRCLQEIWQTVLGVEQISIDDNFFSLGGDSILSIQIVSKILQAGFKVGPNDLFEAPTIAQLSLRMAPTVTKASNAAWLVTPEEKKRITEEYGEKATAAFPLSDTQAAFLFSHLSRGAADPGHMQIQARIEGDLDLDLLQRCCSEVVTRHDALRTLIHWRDKAEPEQVVYARSEVKISYENVDPNNPMESIDKRLTADRQQGLNLDQYPSWRIFVFQLEQNESILCWSFHHGLVDGWSASIILQEVIEIYQSRLMETVTRLSDPPQFYQYQRWLSQTDLLGVKKHWTNFLGPYAQSRTDLSALSLGQERSRKQVSAEFQISGDTFLRLEDHLAENQITFAQLLQAAWAACLSSASDADLVAFFTTVSGRTAPVPGIDKMTGQFVNHLPVICNQPDEAEFSEFVSQIEKQSNSLRDCEHVSPNVLQNWCVHPLNTIVKTKKGPVGIQSLLMMENFPWQPGKHIDHKHSILITSLQRRGQYTQFSQSGISSNFPLTLVGVPESNALTVSLHFNSAVFNHALGQQLMATVKDLLISWIDSENPAEMMKLARVSRSFFDVDHVQYKEAPNRNQRYAGNTGLERSIVAIWQDILRQRVENVEQSFFDLGGNSLLAVRVANAIEKLLDLKMPLAMLIENNTVESLAKALLKGAESHLQVLVPIQPQGDKSPIFGIHAEGNVLFYRDLSLSLGDNQPFYGLQSPELGDERKRFSSIEEMAASYIKEIKSVHATGPYTLCGMCFGGLIAFEIAQQLMQSGDKVNELFVLDAGGPHLSKLQPSTSENLRSKVRYSRTAPLPIKVIRHLKTGRFLELTKKYISTMPFVYKLTHQSQSKASEQSTGDRTKRMFLYQAFLTRRYRTSEYPGEVTFLYSEQFQNAEKTQYELSLWNAACGGRLESFLVSGHHRSILEAPQVYEIAEIMGNILQANNKYSRR